MVAGIRTHRSSVVSGRSVIAMSDPWTAPASDHPVLPDLHAGERAAVEQWTDFHRATLLSKCEGLTSEQLQRRSVEPSDLSLLGLVRHMAEVERWWFRLHAGEEEVEELYEVTKDHDPAFDDVGDADAAADLEMYRRECDLARAVVTPRSLDDEVPGHGRGRERTFSVRWIYLHMIEEYARHNGHADFLRERIDGATDS
jgi:uncharacterized damage-inducible protein DinB